MLLSDILQSFGFVRTDACGRLLADSQLESDRGTFLTGMNIWFPCTVAVDQAGWGWIVKDIIDLTPYGFRNISADKSLIGSE